MENAPQTGYRVYWVIFLVLLVLAPLMTLVGSLTQWVIAEGILRHSRR